MLKHSCLLEMCFKENTMDKIILIGAGGHCKVVIDAIGAQYEVVGITDIDKTKQGTKFFGAEVLGNDDILPIIYSRGISNALITLGSIGDSRLRSKLYSYATSIGFKMINAISESAIVSKSVKLGNGNAILNGVMINADTVIGDNCIINTAAVIEHDCIIGDHVHISPGALLAGGVEVGDKTHIGIGAKIIQGIRIGENCIIGAGAVVIRDVPDNTVCVGVPAKVIKSTEG